jgi:flagellar basal-body rod modification protein FlgD
MGGSGMELSSLLATMNQGQASGSTKGKSTLTQEDFMNLFVTQMRNQNPLEPMDNYQMATQLAQFNSVEALQNLTASIKNLELYQASMNGLQLANLIGKKVQASSNTLQKSLGVVSEGYYQLPRTGKVTLQIFDSNGNPIRSIDAGIKDTSEQKFVWDGKDQQGVPMRDGKYAFQVSAVDEKGQSIQVSPYTTGTVTGISFENGISYIHVGSGKITLSEILAIL